MDEHDHAGGKFTFCDLMKRLYFPARQALEKFANLLRSKAELTRRAVLQSEAREQQATEAERLDRLRNPRNYQGK